MTARTARVYAEAMLTDRIKLLRRLALLFVVTLSLVAIGFAHRMPTAGGQALELAMAHGLTVEDLCGDKVPGPSHAGPPCLACQIAGSVDLPPVTAGGISLGLAVDVATFAPRESRALRHVLDLSNAAQGPPVA